MFSYEYEKKIFAYSASYTPYEVDENGVKAHAGAVFIFYYYDEDGDGIFETRDWNRLGGPTIPKWVRTSK